jgi:hypothetical protein
MKYSLDSMLPEKAFSPRLGRGFGAGGMTLEGGSPAPSGGPTQTTVQNTNIPDYAQPYVSNMLNAAQAQIYTPDMTGFNAYTPYSQNPTDYVAGFSPLQQQAQSSAANLQLPGAMGAAQGLTAAGTLGAMGAGQQYAQQATNPNAMQAYMSPYENNVIQQQLLENQRQYGIKGAGEQAAATSAGAFGGTREALMNAENTRNQNTAGNQIVAQGLQNAFQNAQQAQQFGANLGLQGIQAGLGGANQLGNLGSQQLAAQQSILGTQNQLGAQQQNQQQNVINQAVQNYATAQQYPFLQLGMLNSMLRGLPMQQATTQMYQAAPSTVSQLAGLGTAGLGAAAMYNAANKAEGGEIKGYAPGGAIPMSMMSNKQLQGMQQSPAASPMQKLLAPGMVVKNERIQANPEAVKMLAQAVPQMPGAGMPPPQQVAAMPQTRMGLGAISTGDVIPERFANGGIMSFADEGEVPPPTTKGSKGELSYLPEINRRLSALDSGKDPFSGTKEEIAGIREEMKDRAKANNAQALARFGLGMMGGQSQYALENVGKAGLGALDFMSKAGAENAADRKLLASTVRESEAAKYARDTQNLNSLIAAQSAIEAKKLGISQIAAQRESNKLLKEATLLSNASNAYSQRVGDAYKAMAAEEKNKFIFEHNPGLLWEKARAEVYETLPKSQRELLQLAPPTSAAPAPSAAPAAGGATSGQVLVTIPAMNGQPAQTFYAPNQAAADAVNAKIKAMQATQQNPTAAAPIQ